MLSKILVAQYFIILSVSMTLHGSTTARWPAVKPLDEIYDFEEADHAKLRLQILGADDRPLYLLACQGREVEAGDDFEYSGDFECRLTSLYSKDRFSTLFTENPKQQKDWESRGRFFSEELVGNCAEYPEYGRVRNFRLRGMAIRLELSDLVFQRGRRLGDTWDSTLIRSFRFRVVVQPDRSALSAIAKRIAFPPPPYLYPEKDGSPLDCREFQKSNIQ